MSKAGYYTDRDGDTWLRLGKLAIVYATPAKPISDRPSAVWSWATAKLKWGPMTLDTELKVD